MQRINHELETKLSNSDFNCQSSHVIHLMQRSMYWNLFQTDLVFKNWVKPKNILALRCIQCDACCGVSSSKFKTNRLLPKNGSVSKDSLISFDVEWRQFYKIWAHYKINFVKLDLYESRTLIRHVFGLDVGNKKFRFVRACNHSNLKESKVFFNTLIPRPKYC